ncbi:MAG TPA: hypothetical protein VM431_01425 [Phycisphaerae bacterium]|nr:hypothetical protein [Phycisphaerae bacterium]
MNLRTPSHAMGGRPGVAMLVTLIFLAVFACMAVAIASSADMNMTLTRNRLNGQQAGALAETGLQLVQKSLGGMTVPGTHDAEDLHQAIAARLESALEGSSMLSASAIAWSADAVGLPPVILTREDGRTGEIDLDVQASAGALDDTTITIHSTGRFGNAIRRVTYNMTVQRGGSALLDHGIASKGPIQMTGNARIQGANRPEEGSILSATYSTSQAIRLTGNCYISGDAGVCNPDGTVRKTGNVTIGGEEVSGAPEPEWPEVDASVFAPYAVNIRSSGASADIILSNIRIPANTNPTFSGNTTILGVVYIESPNKVKFTGNTNVIGSIVCETPAVDNLKANYIQFTGNVSTSGVENLPEGSQYDGLRELTGSFLLAPGFSTTFAGNFGTINGCMVASEFEFSGSAGGRIKGGVVNLRDSTFKITGDANLTIDLDNAVENPAGLRANFRLVCVSGSYGE